MSLVLIPAYEPDDRLVTLVASLVPQYPVLVVDDGSGPDYAAVFSECARAGARVVHHTHNRGKGAALLGVVGMNCAMPWAPTGLIASGRQRLS